MRKIVLNEDEAIVAVVPEYVSGPGWRNMPVWIYIRDSGNRFRCECLQPDDHSPDMLALFSPGAAMCCALMRAVSPNVKRGKK